MHDRRKSLRKAKRCTSNLNSGEPQRHAPTWFRAIPRARSTAAHIVCNLWNEWRTLVTRRFSCGQSNTCSCQRSPRGTHWTQDVVCRPDTNTIRWVSEDFDCQRRLPYSVRAAAHMIPRKEGRAMARTVNKSAKTGKFVKSATVKKNPSTTYKQTVKTKKSGK